MYIENKFLVLLFLLCNNYRITFDKSTLMPITIEIKICRETHTVTRLIQLVQYTLIRNKQR